MARLLRSTRVLLSAASQAGCCACSGRVRAAALLCALVLYGFLALHWITAHRVRHETAMSAAALALSQRPQHNRIQLDYTTEHAGQSMPAYGTITLAQIAFAMPTIGRPNNTTYLWQTVESMLAHGVQGGQIWLMPAGSRPHPVYQQVRATFPELVEVPHTLPPLSQSADSTPDLLQKEKRGQSWRVSEARDFIFLMREVLRRSEAPFIALHQDVRCIVLASCSLSHRSVGALRCVPALSAPARTRLSRARSLSGCSFVLSVCFVCLCVCVCVPLSLTHSLLSLSLSIIISLPTSLPVA